MWLDKNIRGFDQDNNGIKYTIIEYLESRNLPKQDGILILELLAMNRKLFEEEYSFRCKRVVHCKCH